MKGLRSFRKFCSLLLAAVMALGSPVQILAAETDDHLIEAENMDELSVDSAEAAFFDETLEEEPYEDLSGMEDAAVEMLDAAEESGPASDEAKDIFSEQGSAFDDKDAGAQSELAVLPEGDEGDYDPEEIQKGLELVGKGLESLESPWSFAGFVVGDILSKAFQTKESDPTHQILKELDQMLRNQTKMLTQLSAIDKEIMTTEFMQILRNYLYLDSSETVMTYYRAIQNMDGKTGDYKGMTDEQIKEELAKVLKYSVTGEDPGVSGNNIPKDSLCDLDKLAMDMGTHIINVPVSYGGSPTNDNLFGVYEMNCKYKYHWEHQAYDDWMSFRNSVYSSYMLAANLDAMSLTKRIEDRKAAGEPASSVLSARLALLKEQIIKIRDLYNKSAVIKHSDKVRVYWYKNKNNLMLYSTAGKQQVPVEPHTNYGDSSDFDNQRKYIKGYYYKPLGDDRYKLLVSYSFWRNFISYNLEGGGTALCPTVEWFQQVYEDYGSKPSLYDIFFSKEEGNMTPPSGSNNHSWRFMADPNTDHPMDFYFGGIFHASEIETPMVKFDSSLDDSGMDDKGVDIYMYHAFSNEVNTDFKKNIGGVIGIGVAGDDPGLSGSGPYAERIKDIEEEYHAAIARQQGGLTTYACNTAASDGEWTKGSSHGLRIAIDSNKKTEAMCRFMNLSVDNVKILNNDLYTITGDGPRFEITIDSSYLETLTPGDHSLSVVFDEGLEDYKYYDDPKVTAAFTVIQNTYTMYEKDGSEYKGCSPRDMTAGDSFRAVIRDTSGDEVQGFTWSSNRTSVANVTSDGKVTAISRGEARITAKKGTDEIVCDINVEAAPVKAESITFSKKKYYLKAGRTMTLKALTDPADSTQKLVWSGDTLTVIKPSKDTKSAEITALSPGTCKITVSAKGDPSVKAECSIIISDSDSNFTIAGKSSDNGANVAKVGKKFPMVVTWSGRKPVSPRLSWSVKSYGGKAIINQKGVLTGISEGRVRVEAVNKDNPLKSAYTYVDVYVPIKKVKLNVKSGKVSTDASLSSNALKLEVDITTASGSRPTGVEFGEEPRVIYEMDERYSDYLELTEDGEITAREDALTIKNIPIKAIVQAYNGYEKKLTCKVSVVKENPLKGIKMAQKSFKVGEGDEAYLKANLNPINPDGNMGIKWLSSAPDIVSVDENGKITGIRPGTAYITATARGTVTKKDEEINPVARCKVTVKPSVDEIEITNGSLLEEGGLHVDKTYRLKTKLTYTSKGSPATKGLEWSSSNEKIAIVTADGMVKALKPGGVTITVRSTDRKAKGALPPENSVTFMVKENQ